MKHRVLARKTEETSLEDTLVMLHSVHPIL